MGAPALALVTLPSGLTVTFTLNAPGTRNRSLQAITRPFTAFMPEMMSACSSLSGRLESPDDGRGLLLPRFGQHGRSGVTRHATSSHFCAFGTGGSVEAGGDDGRVSTGRGAGDGVGLAVGRRGSGR